MSIRSSFYLAKHYTTSFLGQGLYICKAPLEFHADRTDVIPTIASDTSATKLNLYTKFKLLFTTELLAQQPRSALNLITFSWIFNPLAMERESYQLCSRKNNARPLLYFVGVQCMVLLP